MPSCKLNAVSAKGTAVTAERRASLNGRCQECAYAHFPTLFQCLELCPCVQPPHQQYTGQCRGSQVLAIGLEALVCLLSQVPAAQPHSHMLVWITPSSIAALLHRVATQQTEEIVKQLWTITMGQDPTATSVHLCSPFCLPFCYQPQSAVMCI